MSTHLFCIGEVLEETCRREVFEETGLRLGNMTYQDNQFWPNPSVLMVGFRGEAKNEDIKVRQIFSLPEMHLNMSSAKHDDVIKYKHFSRYWHFVRGINRSLMNSPHKGQLRTALIFSLIYAWTNGWVNHRDTGGLRRHCVQYDDTVMCWPFYSVVNVLIFFPAGYHRTGARSLVPAGWGSWCHGSGTRRGPHCCPAVCARSSSHQGMAAGHVEGLVTSLHDLFGIEGFPISWNQHVVKLANLSSLIAP